MAECFLRVLPREEVARGETSVAGIRAFKTDAGLRVCQRQSFREFFAGVAFVVVPGRRHDCGLAGKGLTNIGIGVFPVSLARLPHCRPGIAIALRACTGDR